MWDEITVQKVVTKERQEKQQNDCKGTMIRTIKFLTKIAYYEEAIKKKHV